MNENELVKFGGGSGVPATPDDLVAGLQKVNSSVTGGGGGPMLLRLLKSGVYAYSQENIEPEPGSLWAINPYSFQHGFACWGDGELLGEVMVNFDQQPPAINTLQDYGYAWNQQVSMQLQCVTGEDKGTQVQFKGTSTGLRNAFKQLTNDIITQIGHDKEHIVPVVELESDSYQHKKYGEVFFPVLEIQKWVSISDAGDSVEEDGAEEAEPEPVLASDEQTAEEKPSRRRRSKGAAEESKPTRRRRRA